MSWKITCSPVLVVLSAFVSLAGAAVDYSCVKSNDGTAPTSIILNGIGLQCPRGQVCNEFKVNDEPCIAESEMCGKIFECVGEQVKVTETLFLSCSHGLVCNQAKAYPCQPCVRRSCPTPAWSCPGPSDRDVSIMGLALRCGIQEKCNKKNEHPCLPCIIR